MERVGTVIIGGGVVGASVAYHLTERGCRDVLMLEREEMLGLGSTGKATGGVRAQFETDINIKLSLYSMDFFRDWDFDCEYDPKGYLFLATNNLHLEYLDRTGERQRELGYDGVHLLTQAEVAAMVPGVNCDDIVGGSFGPRDGFINPLAILEGFMVEASMSGAKVKTGTLVRLINVENGRVTGLHTSDGTLECDRVVRAPKDGPMWDEPTPNGATCDVASGPSVVADESPISDSRLFSDEALDVYDSATWWIARRDGGAPTLRHFAKYDQYLILKRASIESGTLIQCGFLAGGGDSQLYIETSKSDDSLAEVSEMLDYFMSKSKSNA